MTSIMKSLKELCLEMGVIVLLAAVIGIAWNHTLLLNVWSGKLHTVASSPSSRGTAKLPLPAGLLQVKDLFARKEAVFVDARDDFVFAQGHIKGAIALPLGQFESKLADFMVKVPLETTLVVYCNGYDCRDSLTLGTKLMEKGYRQVYVYEGGYPEWKDAGLPIESGTP
jgi:rhodanese-related sulfurtransferase